MSELMENHEPAAKQSRLSPSSSTGNNLPKPDEQSNALDLTSSQTVVSTIHLKGDINLSMIKFVRVLNENPSNKIINIEGEYGGEKVVLSLEKTPFNRETVEKMLLTTDKSLTKDFTNDVYGNYTAYPLPENNGIKAVIIHPASEMHINKYSSQNYCMIKESPDDYKSITLPFIGSQSFSLDWIYNILDHSSESERIIFEDKDNEKGFILIPDLKWDGEQISNMHLLAVAHKKGIKSLRDLNRSHLPLLINIRDNASSAICQKYGIKENQQRIYVHYQPSFYHFHVHFEPLSYQCSSVERCHLLEDVIQNITLMDDYYQKVTLTFPTRENGALHMKYQESKAS